MSWSVTVDDLDRVAGLPDDLLARVSRDNPAYADDARLCFAVAVAAGLVSATLSGGRTPSPYGGPDTVVMSVVGFDSRAEGHAVSPAPLPARFYPTMIETIRSHADDIVNDLIDEIEGLSDNDRSEVVRLLGAVVRERGSDGDPAPAGSGEADERADEPGGGHPAAPPGTDQQP